MQTYAKHIATIHCDWIELIFMSKKKKIKVFLAESRQRSLSTIPRPEGRIAVPNHHFYPSHNNFVPLPTDQSHIS